jgi:hypothetical protein
MIVLQRKLIGFGISFSSLTMYAGNSWADITVTEPSTWGLLVAGGAAALGVALLGRRRK